VAARSAATYLFLLSLALLGENYKIYLWQKYLCAIAVIFTLTANFWSVQCILMEPSGEFAPILFRQSYGNQTIPIVMILLWKQNMAGIRSLQVNVLNAALHFRECGYHQNNGFVSVVAGKMICNQNLLRKF
jgi:hypothetical protein